MISTVNITLETRVPVIPHRTISLPLFLTSYETTHTRRGRTKANPTSTAKIEFPRCARVRNRDLGVYYGSSYPSFSACCPPSSLIQKLLGRALSGDEGEYRLPCRDPITREVSKRGQQRQSSRKEEQPIIQFHPEARHSLPGQGKCLAGYRRRDFRHRVVQRYLGGQGSLMPWAHD